MKPAASSNKPDGIVCSGSRAKGLKELVRIVEALIKADQRKRRASMSFGVQNGERVENNSSFHQYRQKGQGMTVPRGGRIFDLPTTQIGRAHV